MAALVPDPIFGSIRYRHGAAMNMLLVLLALMTILAFMPNNDPNGRDPKLILLPFVVTGLAFYLYPLVRRTNVVTTSAEGIELRLFIGLRRTFIPWRDVKTVVLWERQAGAAKQSFIGIERTPTASPLPREAKQNRVTRALGASPLPMGVSRALANTSVVSGRIDVQALTRLIASATAEVPVVDARSPVATGRLH
ncbi:hypothetical protein LO763_10880 [Glycomyces sp. A-F 0318]|uniref:hypothetical protein n=1 Tax=Glycomyces amatae TaxID=2881355 RepID=UPI001E2EB528|nr:hypothetical protein [Glycomyces amatae]MCD0444128.1 hypothetical protein [Glycomyces amatae]